MIRSLEAWVREREAPALLAGQNPTFDRDFVQSARLREGGAPEPLLFSRRTLDMHTLAVRFAHEKGIAIPHKGFNTDEIYHLLDMPPEPKPHVGIVGARFEAVALCKLFGVEPPCLAAQRAFVESFRVAPPSVDRALSMAETIAGSGAIALPA